MEDLLKTPDVMTQVIRPLLLTLKERLTGAPTLFVFDEGHLYLLHAVFERGIVDYIRGLRKKNGAVLFATQSIADAARSALAPIISDSCMTRIFLANYHALEPKTAEIYEGWGLNARERDLIAAMVPKRDYYYQGRQGHRVFQLNLGPVGLAFAGASRKADLALMTELYQGNGVQFAVDWLHARGLHQQADHLNREGEVCTPTMPVRMS
jgi:type IV secretion system protein VirB4